MLHILWILIKFILILLGILLGLVLLALLLVLFCPVRYSAGAIKESAGFKEAEVQAKVSWLFQAIGVRFFWKNGDGRLVITLFGVSLDKIKDRLSAFGKWRKGRRRRRRRASKSNRRAVTEEKKDADKQKEQISESRISENRINESQINENRINEKQVNEDQIYQKMVDEDQIDQKPVNENQINKKQTAPENLKLPQLPEETIEQIEKTEPEKTPKEEPEQSEPKKLESKKPGPVSVLFTRIRDILIRIIRFPGTIWRKLTSFIKGILAKLQHIKKNIEEIRNKLDWWREFLGNEKTKAAISLIWKDAKGLIHHVLPTKIEGQVTFGCEDPAVTGAALAVLGMTIPFHKNQIQVTPLFDGENQLTGNVSLKGRIYGIMFVKAALEIYINKNVKYVINRWKHKEE